MFRHVTFKQLTRFTSIAAIKILKLSISHQPQVNQSLWCSRFFFFFFWFPFFMFSFLCEDEVRNTHKWRNKGTLFFCFLFSDPNIYIILSSLPDHELTYSDLRILSSGPSVLIAESGGYRSSRFVISHLDLIELAGEIQNGPNHESLLVRYASKVS